MSVRKRKPSRKNPDYLDAKARALGFRSYQAYIQSPRWQAFAASVIQPRCYCCQRDKPLQIHHASYANFGNEQPSDVVTVCNGCHVKIHEMVKSGAPLADAHEKVRKLRSSGWAPSPTWVRDWESLRNPHMKETAAELRQEMERLGVMDAGGPTRKALANGFARRKDDGTVEWHRKHWLRLAAEARRAARRHDRREERLTYAYRRHLGNLRERFARRMRDIADMAEQDFRRPLAMELMRDTLRELGFDEGLGILETID